MCSTGDAFHLFVVELIFVIFLQAFESGGKGEACDIVDRVTPDSDVCRAFAIQVDLSRSNLRLIWTSSMEGLQITSGNATRRSSRSHCIDGFFDRWHGALPGVAVVP